MPGLKYDGYAWKNCCYVEFEYLVHRIIERPPFMSYIAFTQKFNSACNSGNSGFLLCHSCTVPTSLAARMTKGFVFMYNLQ